MDERLDTFLDHAREKGLDFETVRELLRARGWKDKDIAEAYAEKSLDMPVPAPKGSSTARETFTYFAAFAGLYTWVIALIVLVFTFINLQWPDVASAHAETSYRLRWAYDAIRQSIASILVAFPIFLWLWRSLLVEIRSHPEKAASNVRITLTYVSLGVGVVTLVSDVIALVYRLLEGDLTTRFVLKAAAIFVIAGAACVYLLLTLREGAQAEPDASAVGEAA